jgi:hypothetical protein
LAAFADYRFGGDELVERVGRCQQFAAAFFQSMIVIDFGCRKTA